MGQIAPKIASTLSSRITDTLRDAIVTGEIKPGSKISEPKLAEQFEVSRGPLREAIRRLEMMQLVKHVPHEGVRVITLDLPRVLEIYEVREALEGMAAGLAARNMSAAAIDELYGLLDIHEQHIKTSAGEYMQQEGDYDFHYKVIQGSGNQLLIRQLCGELYHLIRMFRNQASQARGRADLALQEHKQLVYAIEQRDPQLAELIMRRHIARSRDNISTRALTT